MTAPSSVSKQYTEEAERALLALVSAGDRSAMVELYVLHFARLAKLFLHMTSHADLTEELINDTMVEVWRAAASIGVNPSVSRTIIALAYCSTIRGSALELTDLLFEEWMRGALLLPKARRLLTIEVRKSVF